MATNSSRGNPIATSDGPPVQNTASTPHVPDQLKAEIKQESQAAASSGGSAGLHTAGQDAGSAPPGAHVETVEELSAGGGKETGK
ncbi:valine--tRNA ligase [Collariella sp. IMI 366227]|nr:valine--tRNA ligase [Collariella sp. IMI 366227]